MKYTHYDGVIRPYKPAVAFWTHLSYLLAGMCLTLFSLLVLAAGHN